MAETNRPTGRHRQAELVSRGLVDFSLSGGSCKIGVTVILYYWNTEIKKESL